MLFDFINFMYVVFYFFFSRILKCSFKLREGSFNFSSISYLRFLEFSVFLQYSSICSFRLLIELRLLGWSPCLRDGGHVSSIILVFDVVITGHGIFLTKDIDLIDKIWN